MNLDDLDKILGPGNYHRLGRLAGITDSHLSRVLKGQRGISLRLASQLAEAADVTLDELNHYITTRPTYLDPGRRTQAERKAA